jgi:hypothetical protein
MVFGEYTATGYPAVSPFPLETERTVSPVYG